MKNKAAQTKHKINHLIKNRWSPRAFSNKPIAPELLEKFFEAASWAPSSRNEQPWKYLYAFRDDVNFSNFSDCLVPENQSWAKNAAVLLFSLSEKNYARNQKTNVHYMHDTGAANTLLLLQALEDGVYGHMMGGFDQEKTKKVFQLTDNLEPVCFIALGYPGDPETLENSLKNSETGKRTRKPIETFVFQNKLPS